MQIASVDIKYLVKELQALKKAKITKIYQPDKTKLLFNCHVPGEGKVSFAIQLPHAVYVTTEKSPQIEPSAFCKKLRTMFQGGTITSVEQVGLERILKLSIEYKLHTFHCMIELFGKGNFIVCDNNMQILLPLSGKTWKDRTVKRGEPYQLPPERVNPFVLNQTQLVRLIKESKQKSIASTLASTAGLGGKYAEEVLAIAGIDKNKETATQAESKLIHEILQKLIKKSKKPQVLLENNQVTAVLPFPFKTVKETKPIDSLSKAYATVFAQEQKFDSPYQKKIEKIKNILDKQQATVKSLEKKREESEQKGEKIYENYQLIKEIIEQLEAAKKTMSWKEIKAKLKSHKIVKHVNEKTQEVTLEIE